jgi:molybdenum cofactor cytidylyltransferase
MLADQIGVSPADLELLMAAWQRDPRAIVAARAGAVLGPPVILPRSAFRAVRRLHGDTGAKALLSDPARPVIEIGITSAEFDVDTPADLARWRRDAVLS